MIPRNYFLRGHCVFYYCDIWAFTIGKDYRPLLDDINQIKKETYVWKNIWHIMGYVLYDEIFRMRCVCVFLFMGACARVRVFILIEGFES